MPTEERYSLPNLAPYTAPNTIRQVVPEIEEQRARMGVYERRMRTPYGYQQMMAYYNSRVPSQKSMGQAIDYIAENYPGMIGFFNTNQEIRGLLLTAAKEEWSPEKLQAELQATKWYRSTSVAARDFELAQASDPATAAAMVAQTASMLQNQARTLGLGFSGQQLAALATQATRNGWSDPQTIDALLQNLNWSTVQGGTLTATVDDVKAVAADYLVDVSEATARNYSARIASGELTMEGVRSIMQAQARGRFSWMSSEIDNGVTPSDYFAPVRDTIARTLEVAPETINLLDPQWLRLVEVRDPTSGQLRASTLNEAMLAARNTAGWVNTQGSQEMSAGLTQLTREAFAL